MLRLAKPCAAADGGSGHEKHRKLNNLMRRLFFIAASCYSSLSDAYTAAQVNITRKG